MDAKLTRRSAIQWTGAAFVLPTGNVQPSHAENGRMPFTPKFADLVRNIATVTGTGPVTLGAAVNGFASLAQAVEAGDQFYYAIQSVDKAQEREVGRGTMQADGKVARQPIAGDLTSFTGGAKTIALVAPAEWFARIEELGGAAMASASTRAELRAMPPGRAFLVEEGRAGTFLFDPSNLSAMVAADPAQGIHVPPQSDATGASGAWVRQNWRELDPRWFGAVPDNATDASPAFDAAFRVAEALSVASISDGPAYRGGPAIAIGPGRYFCRSTWEPLVTLRIQGAGGLGWGAATQVRFPAGVTGIRAQAHNTSGAGTVDSVPHGAGDSLVIQDIYFIGGFDGVEGEYHGLHAKRPVHVERCTFDNFQGDGLHALTNFNTSAPHEGNTNVLRATNCVFANCRNGIFAEGDDANAWTVIGCSLMSNRQWGIKEDSFLGNHYFGHHFDANARTPFNEGTAGKPCSYVSHGGNHYFVINGQESWCSTNAPSGTTADNQGWGYWQAGAPGVSVPAWFSGIEVRAGGPLLIHGLTNASTATGLHIEINGVSQLDQGAFVTGALGVCVGPAGDHMRERAGTLIGGSGGLRIGGNAHIVGGLLAQGPTNMIGPSHGVPADSTTFLDNTNAYSQVVFRRWAGETAVEDGDFLSFGSVGLIVRGNPGIQFRTKGDNATRMEMGAWGLKVTGDITALGSGNYYSGADKVVGPRQAAIPNAAAGNEVATINAILAALRAHGLIAV